MIALKNILVATDFSKCSVAAVHRDPLSPLHSTHRCTSCTSQPHRFTSRGPAIRRAPSSSTSSGVSTPKGASSSRR